MEQMTMTRSEEQMFKQPCRITSYRSYKLIRQLHRNMSQACQGGCATCSEYNGCMSYLQECKADCEACFNKNFCTKCKNGFYLRIGKCLESCPDWLEPNNSTMECSDIVHCKVNEWSQWSPCTKRGKSCGFKRGNETRSREVLQLPSAKGKLCPHTTETRKCVVQKKKCLKGVKGRLLDNFTSGLRIHPFQFLLAYRPSHISWQVHQSTSLYKLRVEEHSQAAELVPKRECNPIQDQVKSTLSEAQSANQQDLRLVWIELQFIGPHPAHYLGQALVQHSHCLTWIGGKREVELGIISVLMIPQPTPPDDLSQRFHVDVKQQRGQNGPLQYSMA
ncbi:R-spondin-3 [Varanus komodoensis]|nr:R-spondin-3 [Varanus komodoensis]